MMNASSSSSLELHLDQIWLRLAQRANALEDLLHQSFVDQEALQAHRLLAVHPLGELVRAENDSGVQPQGDQPSASDLPHAVMIRRVPQLLPARSVRA